MKLGLYVMLALNLLVWGGFALIGTDLVLGVASRHIPGYPNWGQITYSIAIPTALGSIAVTAARSLRTGKRPDMALGVLILTVGCLPFYLYGFGGGI